MSLKVYFPYGNPRGTKILLAAELANVKIEHIEISYEAAKKEEHCQRHPLGLVPVLETEGGYVYESNAILRHIARINQDSKLYGETLLHQAMVDQWLDFVTTQIEGYFYPLILSKLGRSPIEASAETNILTEVTKGLKVLDNHLKGNNYLVGNGLTIADVATFMTVNLSFRLYIDESVRKTLPNLVRWYEHVASLPAFLKHFGRPRLSKTAFVSLRAEVNATKQTTQEQQKKAPQEGKKQEKKKEEKKKEVKAEVVKDEEEEEEKPVKKAANPLDLLPPSKFNIDDWKRQFLAAKTTEQQNKEFESFWLNFDAEGFSMWEVLYEKDPETEGKVLIKTNNTMNGFLQRSDPHFRKYAFAIHGVYGDEPNLEIRGAWLWRGTEVPQELIDHPSYELHKFIKLNKDVEADRLLYQDYWLNQTEDESKVKGLTARTLVYYR